MGTPVVQTLSLQSFVIETDKYIPLTGEYSQSEAISGWRWDRRILESEVLSSTRHLSTLGGHSTGLLDGTASTDWVSGTPGGIEFTGLREGDNKWIPVLGTGTFAIAWDRRPLFSDYSFSQNVDTADNVDGVNTMELREDCRLSTIDARIFCREGSAIYTWKHFPLLEDFEEFDSTNLSRTHGYTLDDLDMIFLNDYSFKVGCEEDSADAVEALWEAHDNGYPVGRKLYTKYFPLQSGSVAVVSIDEADVVTSWTEVTSLATSLESDTHFVVNHDLGIITLGGYSAPSLRLRYAINASVDALEVFLEPDKMASYPDQGYFTIDSEIIEYGSRTSSKFLELTRGAQSTTAATHTRGALIEDGTHGAGTSDNVYVSYTVVPRIEYEVTETEVRSANAAPVVDVKPFNVIDTRNILQIVSRDLDIAQIVLETDSPLIGGTTYGPVYFGTDVSRLTARALDSFGSPVQDVELTIELQDGLGYLNDNQTSVTGITNSRGEIYAYFIAPYDQDDIRIKATTVSHDAGDTEMVLEHAVTRAAPNDIWVFQILKHDPARSTVGDACTVLEAFNASAPWGNSYFVLDGLYDERYEQGLAFMLDISVPLSPVKTQFSITKIYHELDTDGRTITRVYVKEVVGNLASYENTTGWLVPRGADTWDSATQVGVAVLLYEWNIGYEHPITGEAGAYGPLHPSIVSGSTLTFADRVLAIPDASDDDVNLGGYAIISTGDAAVRAFGRDPFTDTIVLSNTIKLSLDLPSQLKGVDETGILPIPFGMRLVSEDFNVGTGLGGANFLTVNAKASGVNSLSIMGVIS